jgi:cytochrome c2
MPRKDTAALVDYFAALDGKMDPYVHFDKKLVTTESLKAGRELFHKAECFSCHGQWPPAAGVEPPSAVNLNYAKNRIRPEWILRWIQNPQKIVPGTKMPVYFEGAGVSASIVNGKLAGQDNRRWIYELTAEKEAELAEEQTATLLIGAKSIPVIVAETDEKNIKISSPENLGATFGRASITSHGEPIDPKLLDGDGLRQIKALRDFIMLENNFKKPSKTN